MEELGIPTAGGLEVDFEGAATGIHTLKNWKRKY